MCGVSAILASSINVTTYLLTYYVLTMTTVMFYLAEVVAVRECGERPASIVGDDNQSATTDDVHLSTYVTLTTYVVARTVNGQAESQSQLRQQTLYDVQHERTRTCYLR